MQPLRSVLTAFAERPDVAGAVLVSDDGLVVEARTPGGLDVDELSALATTAARSLAALCEAGGAGTVDQAVIDGSSGTLVLQRLPTGALLIILAAPEGDVGQLLYEVRRHAPALVSLL
jgi:predicted regulator of Ras-like GTPase activity (Roadblock/LC7/MglB family)